MYNAHNLIGENHVMTTGHTHSAPHGVAHGRAHDHGHDHAHPHPHPHSHVKPSHSARYWWAAGLVVLLAGGGLAAWMMSAPEEDSAPAVGSAQLIKEMREAADGWERGRNAFGGEMKSDAPGASGKRQVTASGIPNKPCVETGWALAKDGLVTVNGVFLPRISAAKLAEVCASANNKSVILWQPK